MGLSRRVSTLGTLKSRMRGGFTGPEPAGQCRNRQFPA